MLIRFHRVWHKDLVATLQRCGSLGFAKGCDADLEGCGLGFKASSLVPEGIYRYGSC